MWENCRQIEPNNITSIAYKAISQMVEILPYARQFGSFQCHADKWRMGALLRVSSITRWKSFGTCSDLMKGEAELGFEIVCGLNASFGVSF